MKHDNSMTCVGFRLFHFSSVSAKGMKKDGLSWTIHASDVLIGNTSPEQEIHELTLSDLTFTHFLAPLLNRGRTVKWTLRYRSRSRTGAAP